MEIIIIGFHIVLVIGIVLLVQAIQERKKQKALATTTTEETKPLTTSESKPTAEPVSEQKQAVQLVHTGLENVIRHVTHLENPHPEMVLSDAGKTPDGALEDKSSKHCPTCDAPWDDAFDFCLKCSNEKSK